MKLTLKEGAGSPWGSRGVEILRSREQKIDQRDSSEAETFKRLLTQATFAVFSGPILDNMMWRTKSPASSRPIAFVSDNDLSRFLSGLLVGLFSVLGMFQSEETRKEAFDNPLTIRFGLHETNTVWVDLAHRLGKMQL